MGVGRTFQTATVFEKLTVLQNLDIAAGAARSAMTLLRKRSGVPTEVTQAMETIGLTELRDTPAGILAHGQKQWLEIGMLLVQDAQLLMLDEPVAGMSSDEREQTGRLLQRIAEDRTVVIVEHDMDFMRSFAKSVTVLAAGKILSEGTVAEVQADPKVQEVYLGTRRACRRRRRGSRRTPCGAGATGGAGRRARRGKGGRLMLEMIDVHVGYGRTDVIHGVSVSVPADGVAAVMGHNGAGKTTLLRAAVGLLKPHSGRILLGGEDVTRLHPNQRVARGLAYVPQGQQSFGQLTTS